MDKGAGAASANWATPPHDGGYRIRTCPETPFLRYET